MKKEALARLDRELARQIEQMPNHHWQKSGEQTHHPEVKLASRIVRDVVVAEQKLRTAEQRRLAKRLADKVSDSDLSQEAAFASIDTRKVSKTSGKAIVTARVTSTPGSSALSPADDIGSTQCVVCIDDNHGAVTSDIPIATCMTCFEEVGSAKCVFPMVLRQPQVGDLVLARYKPNSASWKSATVLRTSPVQVRQPWVAVTFEGFTDEVIILSDRLRFAPAAVHAAASVLREDDGAVGWACGHALCSGCFEPYLESLVANGRAEVTCCQPDCNGVITIERCSEVLGSAPIIMKLRQMQNEDALTHKVFCANNQCSAVFDAVYATLGTNGVKSWPKVQCPRCCMDMCADCRVPWHLDVKCDSFQKLPGDFRDQADLDLLRLAAEQQFRKCPSCGELVEKRLGDCNFIKCRCLCEFCYCCGVRYKKHTPTANNVHGSPGCECALFDNVKPHEDAAAVILGPADRNQVTKKRTVSRPDGPYRPGKDKVKFKCNMDILPVPCKFSRTNAGCPWGKKCWYTHEDDD